MIWRTSKLRSSLKMGSKQDLGRSSEVRNFSQKIIFWSQKLFFNYRSNIDSKVFWEFFVPHRIPFGLIGFRGGGCIHPPPRYQQMIEWSWDFFFPERSKKERPRNSIFHQNIEYFEFYSITKKIMHDFGGNFSKYSKYVLMGENRYQNHTYTHQYLILTKMRSKVN